MSGSGRPTQGSGPSVAPYGSWRSPLDADLVFGDEVVPSWPRVDGEVVYWLESRPAEDGRDCVVRRLPDGRLEDAVPAGVNARTMVHEYGGGAWAVEGGTLVYSDRADGRLYRRDGVGTPVALTPPGPFRYADPSLDLVRRRVVAVREDHGGPGEAVNTLVEIPLGGGEPQVLVGGHDFVSAPRLSPDGRRLAYLAWEHPNLPWDGCELHLAELDEAGAIVGDRVVAGSASESVTQPRWAPDGRLLFVAEPDGWWNLYAFDGESTRALAPMEAEFGLPDWILGLQSYVATARGEVFAVARREGQERLWRIPAQGEPRIVDQPYTQFAGLALLGERLVVAAASWTRLLEVAILDPADGSVEVLRRSSDLRLDPALVSVAQHIEYATSDGGRAHANYYAPRNPAYRAPAGELPPLVVTSHGGPTSGAATSLRLGIQYLTSRGLAVVDVDYRGSTGYGREYRRALEGNWGVYDVDDCVAVAHHLAAEGLVDRARVAIEGGSASGYTTLCALTFRDDFRAGVSYFGIGDLETFAHDTHKFESRYLDRLVGPLPAARRLYYDRSPVHFLEGLSCPLLILQGLEDRVVPPSQAEEMVEALRAKGLPYAYLPFEGEGHGFRRLENQRRSTEAELAFYGAVFGFTPADELPPLPLEGPVPAR